MLLGHQNQFHTQHINPPTERRANRNMPNPTNILRKAVQKLEAFCESSLSEFAVYRPAGEQRTAQIRVTPGGSRSDADQADSMRIEADHQDFLIRIDTQVNDTEESFSDWLGREPVQNDEITFDGQKYLVTPVFGGEPFRYQNGFRTCIRIHTVHAGAQ